MQNKILYLFYYFLAFIIAEISTGIFLTKIIPTWYYYLGATWTILIFEWFVITIFLLAAAEFVYRKTNAENIFWPCTLIIFCQVFSISHSFLMLVSGASAGLILYIITKSNKLILQSIYKYLLLLLWIFVGIFVVHNYLAYISVARCYQSLRFVVILLVIFVVVILRIGFMLRKSK